MSKWQESQFVPGTHTRVISDAASRVEVAEIATVIAGCGVVRVEVETHLDPTLARKVADAMASAALAVIRSERPTVLDVAGVAS